jgi:uncharacterized membrane protein YbhN (UPF0104 family)
MRRTLISNLQWWLFVALLTVTFVLYPHVADGPWWLSTIFIIGFYFAFMAVFRLRFETPQQARERRRACTVPVVIFRGSHPVGTEKAPTGSRWFVTAPDSGVLATWVQFGTYRKPVWSSDTPEAGGKEAAA